MSCWLVMLALLPYIVAALAAFNVAAFNVAALAAIHCCSLVASNLLPFVALNVAVLAAIHSCAYDTSGPEVVA